VAVWAEHPQVLDPVIVLDAVYVIEVHAQGQSPPIDQAADVAAVLQQVFLTIAAS